MALGVVRLAVRTRTAINVMRRTGHLGLWIRFDFHVHWFRGMVTERTGRVRMRSQRIHVAHLARTRSTGHGIVERVADMRMRRSVRVTRPGATDRVRAGWWSAWSTTQWRRATLRSAARTADSAGEARVLRRGLGRGRLIVFVLLRGGGGGILGGSHLFVGLFATRCYALVVRHDGRVHGSAWCAWWRCPGHVLKAGWSIRMVGIRCIEEVVLRVLWIEHGMDERMVRVGIVSGMHAHRIGKATWWLSETQRNG